MASCPYTHKPIVAVNIFSAVIVLAPNCMIVVSDNRTTKCSHRIHQASHPLNTAGYKSHNWRKKSLKTSLSPVLLLQGQQWLRTPTYRVIGRWNFRNLICPHQKNRPYLNINNILGTKHMLTIFQVIDQSARDTLMSTWRIASSLWFEVSNSNSSVNCFWPV